MRIIQLVNPGECRVVHTFVTDEVYPLDVYNSMLEEHGGVLVEGAGLAATPIGKVVAKFITQVTEQRLQAQVDEARATSAAAEIVRAHAAPSSEALTLPEIAELPANAPAIAAGLAPAPAASGLIDPRTTAVGGGDRAPMPHRNSGPVAAKPPEEWLIQPGRSDGLGSSTVIEVRGGEAVRVPGWRPKQLEGEDVERAPGAVQPITDETP
jgi:hypothetical protein